MSQNPYAQPGPQYADTTPADARTSILAVLSLISGVAGLIICCIPFIGLLGVLFGVPALFSISAARGRKKGSGMAITGVVTGLIGAAIGTAMWAGGAWVAGDSARHAEIFREIAAGDVQAVESRMSADAAAAIDAQTLASFEAAWSEELGAFKGAETGVLAYVGRMATAGEHAGPKIPDVMNSHAPLGPASIAFCDFERGRAVAVFIAADPQRSLANVGLILESDGSVIWLLPPPGQSAPAPAEPTEAPEGEAPPDGDEGGG